MIFILSFTGYLFYFASLICLLINWRSLRHYFILLFCCRIKGIFLIVLYSTIKQTCVWISLVICVIFLAIWCFFLEGDHGWWVQKDLLHLAFHIFCSTWIIYCAFFATNFYSTMYACFLFLTSISFLSLVSLLEVIRPCRLAIPVEMIVTLRTMRWQLKLQKMCHQILKLNQIQHSQMQS